MIRAKRRLIKRLFLLLLLGAGLSIAFASWRGWYRPQPSDLLPALIIGLALYNLSLISVQQIRASKQARERRSAATAEQIERSL